MTEASVQPTLHIQKEEEEDKLISSKRSNKLNKNEEEMFSVFSKSLIKAQSQIEKEVIDVERLVHKKK